jgi:ankyrin repeat protein
MSRTDGKSITVSPIWIASQYGSIDLARMLIEAGANVNDISFPLTAAFAQGNFEIAKMLIAAGAYVNTPFR